MKRLSRGFSGSNQVIKLAIKKIAFEFVYSRQQKMNNFYFKDNNDNLRVEVIIVTYLMQWRTEMSSQQAIRTQILSKLEPYILHDY